MTRSSPVSPLTLNNSLLFTAPIQPTQSQPAIVHHSEPFSIPHQEADLGLYHPDKPFSMPHQPAQSLPTHLRVARSVVRQAHHERPLTQPGDPQSTPSQHREPYNTSSVIDCLAADTVAPPIGHSVPPVMRIAEKEEIRKLPSTPCATSANERRSQIIGCDGWKAVLEICS